MTFFRGKEEIGINNLPRLLKRVIKDIKNGVNLKEEHVFALKGDIQQENINNYNLMEWALIKGVEHNIKILFPYFTYKNYKETLLSLPEGEEKVRIITLIQSLSRESSEKRAACINKI